MLNFFLATTSAPTCSPSWRATPIERPMWTSSSTKAPVGPVADQIKRLEHECDEMSEILRRIDRTFITPSTRKTFTQRYAWTSSTSSTKCGARALQHHRGDAPSRRLSQSSSRSGRSRFGCGGARKARSSTLHPIKQLENEGDVACAGGRLVVPRKGRADRVIKWKICENMEACVIDARRSRTFSKASCSNIREHWRSAVSKKSAKFKCKVQSCFSTELRTLRCLSHGES